MKYTRNSEDSWTVLRDGVPIGEVYRAWSRLGGNGWKHTGQLAGTSVFRTRGLASDDLELHVCKERATSCQNS